MSMPVTQHFAVEEFMCHDGTPYPISQIDADDPAGRTWFETRLKPLCDTLEIVHEAAGGDAMFVDSGYRPEAYDARLYNAHLAQLRALGRADDHLVAPPQSSEHPRGRAADMKHAKLTPVQLFNLILRLYAEGKLPHLGGVGLYPSFVHIDVRPRPDADAEACRGHLAIWGGSRPSNIA